MSETVIRWQGFSHKELYRLLHEGTGPTASAEPSRRWADIASTLSEVGQDLQAAIGRSGSGWTGAAAGAAYDVLAPLASWAQATGESATGMRTGVENQGNFLATARAAMPVPEDVPPATPDPTVAPAVQVIASGNDTEPIEKASSVSAQKAVEVMTAYQHSTDANTAGLADFTSPSAVGDFGSSMHRHTGGGIHLTTPIISIGIDVPPEEDHSDHGDHGHHHHDRWSDWDTGAASATGYVEPHHTYLPGPGSYTGASPSGEPFYAGAPLARLDGGARTGTGTGTGGPGASGGSNSGLNTGGGTGTGAPSAGGTAANPGAAARGGLPATGGATGIGTHPGDLQSAAATSQVAAAAGTPTAGAPGAASAGAGGFGGTGGDSRMPRRLGMDPIGSGQWFGDPVADVSTVGGANSTRRRRDFGADRVTESVSIDGEEHQLPPGVIGEGPR